METDNVVEWLLEQEPSVALQWLQERLEGTQPFPEGFHWRGLAELASSDTFHKPGKKAYPVPDLGWAKVAVLAHRYVIDEEKNSARLAYKPASKKFSYLAHEVSLMSVQVRCILAFGHVAGDPVLDVNHLIQCFFEDQPFSPDDVLNMYAQENKDLLSKEHRELVRIRKKLEVLRPLEENHVLASNQDLLRWFSVWDQLHF